MEWPKRAWGKLACWALGGLLGGCNGPARVAIHPDDLLLDRFWVAVERGDRVTAESLAGQVDDPLFGERCRRDLQALIAGRAATLLACLADGSWWATRYRASAEDALAELEEPRATAGEAAAVWLERARRSGTGQRLRACAAAAISASPGGLEALALRLQSQLAEGDLGTVADGLASAPADSARLALLRRQLAWSSGRRVTLGRELLSDLAEGRAVPESLELLGRLLDGQPRAAFEADLARVLEADAGRGWWWERARQRLLSRLAERRGDPARARAELARVRSPSAEDDARGRRLEGRLDGERPSDDLETRVDRDAQRASSEHVARLNLFAEWSLSARAAYRRADRGTSDDLAAFLAGLDRAAAPLGDVPRLSELPWRSFGVFGDLLDASGLGAELQDSLVVGGQALGMAPELTVYDLRGERRVADPAALDGSYRECDVGSLRVPGRLMAAGARIVGAGLIDVVFLDADALAREAAAARRLVLAAPLPPQPAAGRLERRALREPLDVATRLFVLAASAAGESYPALLRESLAIHERQHIRDAGAFLQRGFLGQLGTLLGAGLLPGAVRAELELRAQRAALSGATDPRIALAQLVERMPVEGAALQSEHARGYADLLAEFIEVLDDESWEGAVPLAELGLSRGHVLVQQLHRLEPATISAIARALPGGP